MIRALCSCRHLMPIVLAVMLLVGTAGCHAIFPDVSHQPVVHNPFPQLSRVAVAPFFNLSDEKTVDGRKFALAYFCRAASGPGFRSGAAGRGGRSNHRTSSGPFAAQAKRTGWGGFSASMPS